MKLRSTSVDTVRPPESRGTTSRLSRDQRTALKAMATPDDERERYVADLKRRVDEHTYAPTGTEIADAILAERLADTSGN
jgi:hypothetical protein